jgi:ornithine decarboxylase
MYKLDQNKTPLFSVLKDVYVKNEVTPFHVPGHKKGDGGDEEFLKFMGENPFKIDVTLFKMVDSLHNPKSVIKEAQELAADAYGSKRAFFSVHGTSGAIQAMIMSALRPGEKILVPRNVHKSVNAGIILSGAEPVYMQPEIDNELGIAHGVSVETIKAMLKEHSDVKAVLIINPTYYGVAADIKSIADVVHSYGIPLLVDEAHGPHLKFHEDLPISAIDAGADICCQSTHKILSAMTQVSILHINSNRIDGNRVQQVLNLLHTTSPSYVLMASLDCCRRQIAMHGRELLENTIQISKYLREEINKIPGISSFGEEVLGKEGRFAFDPTKVTISAKELGLTGFQLESILIDDYNIQVELSDFYNVLAVITIGDTKESVDKLIAAMKDISKRNAENIGIKRAFLGMPQIPEYVQNPREAFHSEKTRTLFEESEGMISGETILAYPPGIPIICPGERISRETIEYIKDLKKAELQVQGMEDPTLTYIKVIMEEDAVYIYVEKMKNKILGMPLNFGANNTGIEFSIDNLLTLYPEYQDEVHLIDVEREKEDFTNVNLKYKNTILKACEKLAKETYTALNDGYRTINIGGDHSLTLGSFSGVSKDLEVGLIWMGARSGMLTDETSTTGNINEMVLSLLQGVGDNDLQNCFYEGKKLKSENLVIFGVMDMSSKEKELIDKLGIKVYNYEKILRKGVFKCLSEIKNYLKVDHIHISFDFGVMDPVFAPAVSSSVRGGFNPDEIIDIFKFLFKNYYIPSVDMVEYNPVYDVDNKTLEFMVDLLEYTKNPF